MRMQYASNLEYSSEAHSTVVMACLCRCNMVPGYVVPCNQVAFSQPTGDGVALAAAFARTHQFLVYGIEQS